MYCWDFIFVLFPFYSRFVFYYEMIHWQVRDFHANHLCVLIHVKNKIKVAALRWNMFKPYSNLLSDCSKAVLLLWILCVICVSCLSLSYCSLQHSSHLLGKCWPLICDVFLFFLLLSHVVSWVRCSTWLYQFLIFAFFFTLLNWFDCFSLVMHQIS